MTTAPLRILIVDDDHGHCELVRRNLRRSGIANDIAVAHRGDVALDMIFHPAAAAADDKTGGNGPLLVLLDINMPGGLSGLDVLRAIKADVRTRMIPVVMLTTTDDPREVNRCYDLGCSIYITKPVDPEKFVEAVKRLGLLLSIIRLPSDQAGGAENV